MDTLSQYVGKNLTYAAQQPRRANISTALRRKPEMSNGNEILSKPVGRIIEKPICVVAYLNLSRTSSVFFKECVSQIDCNHFTHEDDGYI
jgi:hypothetical protein